MWKSKSEVVIVRLLAHYPDTCNRPPVRPSRLSAPSHDSAAEYLAAAEARAAHGRRAGRLEGRETTLSSPDADIRALVASSSFARAPPPRTCRRSCKEAVYLRMRRQCASTSTATAHKLSAPVSIVALGGSRGIAGLCIGSVNTAATQSSHRRVAVL
ncbi:hypothetical protein RTBOTA2_001173 [Rhodotorula toruloides]|nr:hypothetical protein RTBOTA2_001173 [Rhodotorula toruloides]